MVGPPMVAAAPAVRTDGLFLSGCRGLIMYYWRKFPPEMSSPWHSSVEVVFQSPMQVDKRDGVVDDQSRFPSDHLQN